jgi:hypothetical protein
MKSLYAIFIIAFLTGCGTVGTQIRGNGNIKTTHRDIGDARAIQITGSFHTEIVRGDPGISITGDENLFDYMVTEVKDDQLFVHLKYRTVFFNSNALTVKISLPDINEIKLDGSGEVSGDNDFINTKRLTVQLKGTGIVNLTVRSSELEADLDGSGRINIKGETNSLMSRIDGSGELNTVTTICKNADITIVGSGKAKVFASQSLNANISGSGNIYYTGNASVNKNITHSGRVVKM